MQSLTSKIFMALLRAVFHSPLSDSSKLSDNAGKITDGKKSGYRPSRNFGFSKHLCEDVKYERLISLSNRSDKVILMLHGGSFKVGLIDTYRRLAEKYSRLFSGATVISVDYGKFPEHKPPSQMYDVVKVYLHLLETGVKSSDIVFIGDSAGAMLALTSTLWLRDNNYPLPCHIVCFSLWADATSSGESRITNAYTDPFNGISRKKKIEDNLHILRRISSTMIDVDRTDPYISPLFGSFENFPAVTLVCGTAEVDESDNDRIYEKMRNAHVDVRLYKFEGMCHCFQLFGFLPESARAYDIVKARLKGEKYENS
ncbi:MAG: alpha/beta hydrolase fold domain-containing protein [Clostridia bacterium]|nr:alpha/beta hydrolase fold domain-containing protein [Clostridia bacterium]